jgi:hypothetical protein
MTKLLEEAFARASRLSAEEQEALGALIIEELEAEAMWDKSLGSSQAALEHLADEALKEHRAGRTNTLDPS